MNNVKIEHLIKIEHLMKSWMKSWREIKAWREACKDVQIAASRYGDSPEYASALEYRDSIAHQTLGIILTSFGICGENGETL